MKLIIYKDEGVYKPSLFCLSEYEVEIQKYRSKIIMPIQNQLKTNNNNVDGWNCRVRV